MSDNEMRIVIAEARGFRPDHQPHGQFWVWPDNYLTCSSRPYAELDELPPLDLDEIHEAVLTLPDDNSLHGLVAFCNNLMRVCGTHQRCVNATARQRAEAFIKTICPEKWKGDA